MRSRRRLVTLALVLATQLAVVVVWLAFTPNVALRRQLMQLQFWVLETQFILIVALSLVNVRQMVRFLRPTRQSLIAAFLLAAGAWALVVAVAPRTNRIYYDEHIYEGIAQNLSDLHRAQMCNEGIVEYGSLQCSRAEYNKEPNGFPYLVSVGYRIFGVHTFVAHGLNALCAAALVFVVFLIACTLFNERAGVFAALVAALIPQQLAWSHTAAVEPSAALTCAMAMLAALHYARVKSTLSLVGMTSTVAFALQFRPESILVLPVIALILALFASESFTQRRFWWAVSFGVALCMLHAGHLFAMRNEGWGANESRMSIRYLWPNFKVNGPFYINNHRFPALYTVLALCGLALQPRRAAAVPCLMFMLFWTVYLVFYAGSYEYGADVRFSLMTYPAIAVLAGGGAAALLALATAHGWNTRRTASLFAMAVAAQFLDFAPQVRALGEEAWGARADVVFAEMVARELPPNSVVLTHNPSIFLINGVNAAQMSLATTDSAYVWSQFPIRFAGGVYLHWNAWCNYDDPAQKAFCSTTLAKFPHALFKEYRERDYRFAFYRLTLKK